MVINASLHAETGKTDGDSNWNRRASRIQPYPQQFSLPVLCFGSSLPISSALVSHALSFPSAHTLRLRTHWQVWDSCFSDYKAMACVWPERTQSACLYQAPHGCCWGQCWSSVQGWRPRVKSMGVSMKKWGGGFQKHFRRSFRGCSLCTQTRAADHVNNCQSEIMQNALRSLAMEWWQLEPPPSSWLPSIVLCLLEE